MSRTESLAQQLPTILASDADFCFSSPEDAMVALGSSLNPSALADREQLLRHIETLTFHNQRMALALIAHTPNGQRLLDEFRSYGGVSSLENSQHQQQYHLPQRSTNNNTTDLSNTSLSSQQHQQRSEDVLRLDAAAQELAFRHMRQANVRLGMFYETMRERLAETEAENKKMEQLVLRLKAQLEGVQNECALAQGAETRATAHEIELAALRKSEAELRRTVSLLKSSSPTVTVLRGDGQQHHHHHQHQPQRDAVEEELHEFPAPAVVFDQTAATAKTSSKNARTQTDEHSIIYFSSNTPGGSSGGSTAMFPGAGGGMATAAGSSSSSRGAAAAAAVAATASSNSNTNSSTSFHSTSLVQCLLAEVEEEEAKERQRISISSGNPTALRRRIFSLEVAGLEQARREEENVAYTSNALYEAHRNVMLLEEDNASLRKTAETLEREMEKVAVEAWRSTSEKLQAAMAQVRRQIQERIDDAYLAGQKEALALVNYSSAGAGGASSSVNSKNSGGSPRNNSSNANHALSLGARPFSAAAAVGGGSPDGADAGCRSDSSSGEEEEEDAGQDIDDFVIRRHHRLSPRQQSRLRKQQQQQQISPRNNSATSTTSSSRRSRQLQKLQQQKQQQQQQQQQQGEEEEKVPRSSAAAVGAIKSPARDPSPPQSSAYSSSAAPTTIVGEHVYSGSSKTSQYPAAAAGVPPLAMPPIALGQLRENLRVLDSIDPHQRHCNNSARSHRSTTSTSVVSAGENRQHQQQQLPFPMQNPNTQPHQQQQQQQLSSRPNSARKLSSVASEQQQQHLLATGSIGNMSSIIEGDEDLCSGRMSGAASDLEEIVL